MSRSSEPSAPDLDGVTERVLGLETYLERLQPDSDPARTRLDQLISYHGPGERSAWQMAIEHLRKLQNWRGTHADEARRARRLLDQLHDLERPLERLAGDETLREVDLFYLKRCCYVGKRIFERVTPAADALDAIEAPGSYCRSLMSTLHPGGETSRRFELVDELDDDLEAQREALDEAREALADRRETLEARVVRRNDGRFTIAGVYRPPWDLDEQALVDEPLLEHVDGDWQLDDEHFSALDERRATLEDEIEAIEVRVRRRLTETLRDHRERLEHVYRALLQLDVRLAKVRLADELDACWGQWYSDGGEGRRLERAVHPGLLAHLDEDDVQPIEFEIGEKPAVVTGPNMGGKSALLTLVGLCQWCAQHALPVPAESFQFEPVHGIVYVGSDEPRRIEDEEGLSSFGREVERLVTWWSTEAPALWLLDEVGRGTHPEEGAELACDIVERLRQRGHRLVVASHFPDVARLPDARHFRIRGLREAERLDAIRKDGGANGDLRRQLQSLMDYQPVEAEASDVPREARRVARALGLPLDDGPRSS